jgi:U4/U6.U5 tri-snRNP-associated protein 3
MDLDKPLPGSSGKTTSTSKTPGGVEEQQEDEDSDTAQLHTLMGFTGFKTTKNQKVPGNDVYGVRKEKKTVYRQYMNRVGGFNRPLSPTR